jgi:hypothetical protein
MQRAMPSCGGTLTAVQHGLAALCYERTRVQLEQNKYRHCVRDERHERWEQELKQIEERRRGLIVEQKLLMMQKNGLKKSKINGFGM